MLSLDVSEWERERNETETKFHRFEAIRKCEKARSCERNKYVTIYIYRKNDMMNERVYFGRDVREMWEKSKATFSKRTSLCLNRNFIRIFLPLSLSSITLSNNESCNSLWTFLLSVDVSFTTSDMMMMTCIQCIDTLSKKFKFWVLCEETRRV